MGAEAARPDAVRPGAGRGLSARDRRALTLGVAVSAVALFVAFVVAPLGRRWTERGALIDARRAQLARLHALAGARATLAGAVAAREERAAALPRRLLLAPSAALAAAGLQGQLHAYAAQSQLAVSELNVAGAADTAAGALPAIPATLVATGDVYALADFLSLVRAGPRVLEVRELDVRVNPALRRLGDGDVLQITMAMSAPFVVTP